MIAFLIMFVMEEIANAKWRREWRAKVQQADIKAARKYIGQWRA